LHVSGIGPRSAQLTMEYLESLGTRP
jgi:hypothetical protein